MSTVSLSTTFNTVAVVATGSACAMELAMTEHASTATTISTPATNRVRVASPNVLSGVRTPKALGPNATGPQR